MRKTLLFLLVASASVPALAAPDDDANDRAARHEAARAERAEARAERQAERQVERAQPPQRSEPQVQVRSVEPSAVNRPSVREQREVIQQRVIDRGSERNLGAADPRQTLEQRGQAVDSVRDWRARERRVGSSPAVVEPSNGTLGGTFREPKPQRFGRDAIGNNRAPIVSRVPREGTQPPLPTSTRRPSTTTRLSSLTANNWRNHWRSDHRYDWREHRRRHHSLFHFGFYFDPFGWNYQPYSIGWRLWPSYYRSNYWLNDPWMYRLPYAPPGYRWIRYYDDALLVDMWDGTVVDVIRDFFW
ncbi:MAG: RcnB family protein [Sphingomicrobium sp.]